MKRSRNGAKKPSTSPTVLPSSQTETIEQTSNEQEEERVNDENQNGMPSSLPPPPSQPSNPSVYDINRHQQVEYTKGHPPLPLTLFSYPEMLHVKSPEMLHVKSPEMFNKNVMDWATVEVKLLPEGIHTVEGKIAALIEMNGFYPFRVGNLLFKGKHVYLVGKKRSQSDPQMLHLERKVVPVPSGLKLQIYLDLKIETSINKVVKKYDLKQTPTFSRDDNETSKPYYDDTLRVVEVNITWQQLNQVGQFLSQEQHPPVQVQESNNGSTTLEYTIGDAMSFTEFITVLRRVLVYHTYDDDREDIMDQHDFLNVSSTRELPLLAKTKAKRPRRWIRVKLQVAEEPHWATLLMRCDDLYVHGFLNQHGKYGLFNDESNVSLLEDEYKHLVPLGLDVTYNSLLEADDDDEVVQKLNHRKLGKDYALDAVRVLSSYPADPDPPVEADNMTVGEALAGLILMICESARTNPVHDFFARSWIEGHDIRCTKTLMDKYVWGRFWGNGSRELREWKRGRKYAEPAGNAETRDELIDNPGEPNTLPLKGSVLMSLLQDIHLVRNDTLLYKNADSAAAKGSKVELVDHSQPPKDSPGVENSSDPAPSETIGMSTGDSASHGKSPGVRDAGESASQSHRNSPPTLVNLPSGPDNNSPPHAKCHGRPRVELLAMAMRADLMVAETKIVVFDGKRGQIIYMKKDDEQEDKEGQEQQEMVELVLTGPYTGISADYGCFAIQIDTTAASAGSSSGSAYRPIEWEWNCDDPDHAAQIDIPPVKQRIQDAADAAEVTYAVMSNALEATVEVTLQLKDDGDSPIVDEYGKITALINSFGDVGSVLFYQKRMTDQCFSSPGNDSRWVLKLARKVVAVPCREELQIKVDLPIKTSSSEGKRRLQASLKFKNGESNQIDVQGGVEVKVAWYPEPKISRGKLNISGTDEDAKNELSAHEWRKFGVDCKKVKQFKKHLENPGKPEMATERPASHQPEQSRAESGKEESTAASEIISSLEEEVMSGNVKDYIEYTIKDVVSFNEFITKLRLILADHTDRGDILDRLSSTSREHPLLARNHPQPERWIRIKLQVAGEESSSATLFVQDNNLYCLGFMNQKEVCYELSNPEGWKLPSECNAVPLDWGITYESILNIEDEEVETTLNSMSMGKTFAADAVRVLSHFAPAAEADGDAAGARRALAGLIVMVCESARINPLQRSIADGWNTGAVFNNRLMAHIGHWELISVALLDWKDHMYSRWTMHPKLAEITGVNSPTDALEVIHLVRNFTIEERQQLHKIIYGS